MLIHKYIIGPMAAELAHYVFHLTLIYKCNNYDELLYDFSMAFIHKCIINKINFHELPFVDLISIVKKIMFWSHTALHM